MYVERSLTINQGGLDTFVLKLIKRTINNNNNNNNKKSAAEGKHPLEESKEEEEEQPKANESKQTCQTSSKNNPHRMLFIVTMELDFMLWISEGFTGKLGSSAKLLFNSQEVDCTSPVARFCKWLPS